MFYNQADLRFRNSLDVPVYLSLCVDEERLAGEIRAPGDPGFRVEVYESDHRIERTEAGTIRENRIRRRTTDVAGGLIRDEEIAHNRAVVLYDIGEAE